MSGSNLSPPHGDRDAPPPLPDLSTGAVAMPTLTREELAVLGDRPVLHDADDENAWTALSRETRDALHDATLRGLLARDLVQPSDGGLALHDTLRTLLIIRGTPSFIAVGDEIDGEGRQPLRAYGVDASEHHTDGVLLEFAADGVHRFLLTTPTDAADRMAVWAVEPRPGVEAVARTLEVLHPTDGAPAYQRAIVLAAQAGARLAPITEDGDPGEAEPVDHESLAAWLTRAWRDPASLDRQETT